jgi:predicted protein tyrosine phosphatase
VTIIVSPLCDVEAVIRDHRPSHMITLLDPHDARAPEGRESMRRLRLDVCDISTPVEGFILPTDVHVRSILEFARTWDAQAPLLVHCFAGISRSTAAAFIVACERNPHTAEEDIAWTLRRAASHALPNRRLVALGDDILQRGGRMVDAVEAIGGNGFATMGTPFALPSRF